MSRVIFFLLSWSILVASAQAAGFDYKLNERLQQIGDGAYVVLGDTEHFTASNGGNVLNTGFIVTEEGVLVVDTGPSLRYGEQLRTLIAEVTDQPIKLVLNTHHHPDHFFGNQAFADVPIAATAKTRTTMTQNVQGYSDAMYRLVGRAMFGTEYVLPTETVAAGELKFAQHTIVLHELSGHTESELVVHDLHSGVLFVGDLVFNRRAATTPHADIDVWLESLKTIDEMQFSVIVPGHGPHSESHDAITETADYLSWLQRYLHDAAGRGGTAAEALHQPLPSPFDALAAMPGEYQRSVHHLFPALEEQSFYQPKSLERN